MLTYTATEFGGIDVQLFMNDGDVRPKTSDEPFEERRIRRRIVELSPQFECVYFYAIDNH